MLKCKVSKLLESEIPKYEASLDCAYFGVNCSYFEETHHAALEVSGKKEDDSNPAANTQLRSAEDDSITQESE
jgi:hypothetical protein